MHAIVSGRAREQPEETKLLEAHDQALPLWERRLASLLPVIAYAPEHFEREVRSLLDLVENRPLEDGYTAWRELSEWGTWWLGYACGAFALFQEAWPALSVLVPATFSNRNGARRGLVDPVRESIGHDLGAAVMRRFSESKWLVPRWQHLEWSLFNCGVLKERWPEFLEGEQPRFPALPNFDLLVSIHFGLDGRSVLAHWSMSYGGGEQLARRLRGDSRYREAVAGVLGADADELVEKAAALLPEMRFSDWANSNAVDVLKGEA
ncbi:MAG TPA: hypothetical protein VFJ76_03080 [Solirubrobacterales bacterium]|nr:hypothetical protein [Solirubrobacterales bacterium]